MNELITYVKEQRGRKKGQLRGVILATLVDGNIRLGWSYTRNKPQWRPDGTYVPPDIFDKVKGVTIARNRAVVGRQSSLIGRMPYAIKKRFEYMENRAQRYFKKEKPVVAAEPEMA